LRNGNPCPKQSKNSFDFLIETTCSLRINRGEDKISSPQLRRQNWDSLAAELDYQAYALCERWSINRKALIRAFREQYDIPPQAFLERIRDRHARALLGKGMRKKEIVEQLGYKHASHLSRRLNAPREPPPDARQKC